MGRRPSRYATFAAAAAVVRWRRAPCGSCRGPRACVALRVVLELMGMLSDAPLGYTKLPAMARRVAAAECDVPWSTRCCPGARRVARIARRSSCVPFVLLGAWLAALLCKPCWPRRCCLRDAESGLAACFRRVRASAPVPVFRASCVVRACARGPKACWLCIGLLRAAWQCAPSIGLRRPVPVILIRLPRIASQPVRCEGRRPAGGARFSSSTWWRASGALPASL